MPSPGDVSVWPTGSARAPASVPVPAAPRRAADRLHEARGRERAGCIPEAIDCYDAAIAVAQQTGELTVLAEALRRLAVLRHRRNESAQARELCHRSYGVARALGNSLLAAEALNTLGGLDLAAGALDDARDAFLQALELGGANRELRARAEQNLGILANMQGDLSEAIDRYERSLKAYRGSNDDHGCAIAYHNLGMVSADRELFDEADRYFQESRAIAERAGDVFLQALCLVNSAEVDVARQRYENARQSAEAALALLDQLGVQDAKSSAYRVIGMVYRETGRPALAESRLKSAIELAVGTGSVLNEADASRELALLYQTMGRNQEALRVLNAAYRLFRRLDARVDLIHVGGKVAEIEGTYLAMVREWGRSLESSDTYTFGHCERVAQHAVATARLLGLDDQDETTILLGAYLHDLGKVRIPHEVLHKAGPLTQDERELVQLHPMWGVELLADVEFPWDIKPIIRWHHEKYDGSGYPDRLEGDEIPLGAQIVGIWDLYDALTTPRAYEKALSREDARAEITRHRSWWSPRVFDAFLRIAQASGGEAARA
jgi:putative nucleotidyltransferase with HDIG domain